MHWKLTKEAALQGIDDERPSEYGARMKAKDTSPNGTVDIEAESSLPLEQVDRLMQVARESHPQIVPYLEAMVCGEIAIGPRGIRALVGSVLPPRDN